MQDFSIQKSQHDFVYLEVTLFVTSSCALKRPNLGAGSMFTLDVTVSYF